jgi:hypothetical protein
MISWLTYRSSVGRPVSNMFEEPTWFWRNTVRNPEVNPWRVDEPVTSRELNGRLGEIKADVGEVPEIPDREPAGDFVLARTDRPGDGQMNMTFKGRATWLLASLGGEPLTLRIRTEQTRILLGEGVLGAEVREVVVDTPDARYSLATLEGEEIASGELPLGNRELQLKVPGPGVYRFTCRRGGAGWQASFPQRIPRALILEGSDHRLGRIAAVGEPSGSRQVVPGHFYVPDGTDRVLLYAHECGTIRVRNPAGEVVHEAPSDGRIVSIPVAPEQAGRTWIIDLTERVRLDRLRLLNLPTVFSPDPRNVFVPPKVAEKDGLKGLDP